MKDILSWHPKLNVYRLDTDDLLLVGESDSFSLSSNQFPLFTLIDGVKSLSKIIAEVASQPSQALRFFQQATQLKHDNILIDPSDGHPDHNLRYYNTPSTVNEILAQYDDSQIINRTRAAIANIDAWREVFSTLVEISPHLLNHRFILVDSFLESALDLAEDHRTQRCFIRPTGDKIWIMSVGPSLTDKLPALQKRLWDNNPTYGLVKQLFPDDLRCLPFAKGRRLSDDRIRRVAELICDEIAEDRSRIVIFDVVTGGVEHHPLRLPSSGSNSIAKQISDPVTLSECISEYHKDGGSRSISPEATLQMLQPFVSPITGVITHLQPLKNTSNAPIQIFSTAFFKKSVVKNGLWVSDAQFVQKCLGKGVTQEQSQASALCEAIERYSALYQGDEPRLLARSSALNQRHYRYQHLSPYSPSQYERFNDRNHPDSQLRQAVRIYKDELIHWLPTWSLSDSQPVYVPLTCCFANTPFDDELFGRWHSNGCAAGNTLEEAILQALYELIERDATAIWWYNRVPRPKFDLSRMDPEYFERLNSALSEHHDFWVLDLTHDIGVPVMAAIGQNRKTSGFSFGFGCHAQPEIAAQRALSELCQLVPIRNQNSAQFNFDDIQSAPYLFPADVPKELARIESDSHDIKSNIETIVELLKKLQMETLVLNYSREPLPIKTAKVFVPGLCHIWPQLANERIYQVPVNLGWLSSPPNESQFNSQALYI